MLNIGLFTSGSLLPASEGSKLNFLNNFSFPCLGGVALNACGAGGPAAVVQQRSHPAPSPKDPAAQPGWGHLPHYPRVQRILTALSPLCVQTVTALSRGAASCGSTCAATRRRRWWRAPPAAGCSPTIPNSSTTSAARPRWTVSSPPGRAVGWLGLPVGAKGSGVGC